MLIKYFYIFLLNSSFINIENIWNVFVSEIDAFTYTSILVTCSPVPLVYVCVWTNAILSQSVCACVFSHIWLCNPKDCSPPGSSVHGILQARILEWVAISSSSGSSWPRDWTHHSCIGKQSAEPLGKPTVTGGPVVKDSKTFTAGVHSIPDWGTKNPTCRVAEKRKKNLSDIYEPFIWFGLPWWLRWPAMWETWVRSLGREDPLEKEMATHSSTLAWKIPWKEEPGRLQSMGVAKSPTWLSDFTFTFYFSYCSFKVRLFI